MDTLLVRAQNICGPIVESNLDVTSVLFLWKKTQTNQDIADLLPYLGSFLAFAILELVLNHLQGNEARGDGGKSSDVDTTKHINKTIGTYLFLPPLKSIETDLCGELGRL